VGYPPMLYATHATAPLFALMKTRARKVCCFGSGRLPPAEQEQYGNPFPFETAIFKLEGAEAAAEVSRFCSQVARTYQESFCVYGNRKSFEWPQIGSEDRLTYEMGEKDQWGFYNPKLTRVKIPDRADLLPPSIARFTTRAPYDPADPEKSFLFGGSHPHLVHEFVMSIIEDRPPSINAVTAADWCAAGLCAHQSALQDGQPLEIPLFDQ
jgi:hypothetical protein